VTTAWAPDGTIEGTEAIDRDFVVAVQWHAECLVARPAHAGLFSAFVAASAHYARYPAGLRRVA
jgi:gamma-glutamyl-gamma-aminobutyrate hydrolase PuuD